MAEPRPTFSVLPPVLTNFWDVSVRHQRLSLTMFHVNPVVMM